MSPGSLARLLLISAVVLIVGRGIGLSQNGLVSIARVNGLIGGDTVAAGMDLRFIINYRNNTGKLPDISNGFRVSSPDGAVWDAISLDTLCCWSAGKGFLVSSFNERFFISNEMDPSSDDTVGFAALRPYSSWLGYDDSAFALTVHFSNTSAAGKHICIDSSRVSYNATWEWAAPSPPQCVTARLKPEFVGLTPGQVHNPGIGADHLGSGYCFLLINCCVGTRGNVNVSGIIDLADLSALVSYLTGGGYVITCTDAANVNGAGIIDLADLSALVSYLTGGGFVLPNCP